MIKRDSKKGYLHCVACGQKNLPPDDKQWRTFRCYKCWLAFKSLGGIYTTKNPIFESSAGVRTGGGLTYHNYAQYCRFCGTKLEKPEYNSRVRFALLAGSECHKCDNCWMEHKFPPASHDRKD